MKWYRSQIAALTILTAITTAVADSSRLPTGQTLHPLGTQINLENTLPLNVALVPHSNYVLVTCGGARQGLEMLDSRKASHLMSLSYQELRPSRSGHEYQPTGSAFYGLALSLDGQTAYAARGSEDKIGIYHIGPTGLSEVGALDEPAVSPIKSNFPSGISVNGVGSRLYAANNLSNTLAVFDVPGKKLLGSVPVGGYPLSVAALPDGSKVYVSSERDGLVSVVDPKALTKIKDIRTGSHPDALLLNHGAKRLFVANGDSDTVSIIDTGTDKVRRTILLRPAQVRGLPGATPTGLALAPDEKTLYVTLADMNAVAVLALNADKSDAVLKGYMATGWYPTAISVLPDDKTLCVTNGKGSNPHVPNPNGPGPTDRGDRMRYVHDILHGTVSLIPIPNPKTRYHDTAQVLADNSVTKPIDPDAAATAKRLAALPIKHIIYIIKENRTYDQVLGDIGKGNSDPSLVLFGRNVTPNLHALASRFVLLDNFYDCAEVSADGWNWSTSGFAEEYVQRTVPENYSEKKGTSRPGVRSYDYEGENDDDDVSLHGVTDVSTSPGGYVWDDVAKLGLSYRNYGCFLSNKGAQPDKPALVGHTCPGFAPFDLKYADSDAWKKLGFAGPGISAFGPDHAPSRFTAWKQEFDRDVRTHQMPTFEIVRLMRDHTSGTAVGADTPQAMAADNDYAVGELVQAVSHSPFWASTAIFVVEDDSQNGPDHVDCHRSTAYVISPYTQHGTVDSHFYNTDSLMRTMEVLMHLPPMTRLDAIAPPLRALVDKPNIAGYTAILPDKTILAAKNQRGAYGASMSRRLDFAEADDVPEQVLNDILWHSIKGRKTPMPAIRY